MDIMFHTKANQSEPINQTNKYKKGIHTIAAVHNDQDGAPQARLFYLRI